MSSFTVGKFIVRPSLRPDNPAFLVYLVFIGDKLIGRSFSCPDIGCCEWIERRMMEDTEDARAAMAPAKLPSESDNRRGHRPRRMRVRKSRALAEEELQEAIAGG